MSQRFQEHRAHHKQLHEAFQMLVADYFAHHPMRHPSGTTVREIYEWSFEQTIEPLELEPNDGARLRLASSAVRAGLEVAREF